MSGLRWAAFSRGIAQALTWANTLFVIRLISPTDLGLAAVAGLFANFLSLLNELGFSVALVQRQMRDEEILKSVFGALLIIGVILTVALYVTAPLLGALVREVRVVPLIRFTSIQFLTMAFAVIPQARLSMDLRFKELSTIGMAAALVGGGSTLVMALNGGGPWSLVVGVVALSITRTLLLNLASPFLHLPRLRISSIRPLARFSGLVVLERTLWYWYMQIDSFVVARVLGAAQLGVYAVGRQLTNIPLERSMEIVNSVALPAFSRVKSNLDHVRFGYLKILRLGAGFAFPVFWGLAVISDPLIRLVIGSKWIAAVPVVQLLCISMPLRMLNSFTAAAVTALGRQDVNIKSLLLAILVIPTAVMLGSHWGVMGVAAGWALGFPFVYFFNAALVRGALGISVTQMTRSVVPAAAAALAMVCACVALNYFLLAGTAPILHLAITIPFATAVYIGATYAISREMVREVRDFARGIVTLDP